MRRNLLVVVVAFAAACARGPVPPAPLDTRTDGCSWCRMAVSDARFAAQIAAPLEEPRFFDDLGCLRDYLEGGARLEPEAVVYVADHRTRAWIPASHAVYTKVPGLATPMASGLVAHADASSRDADPEAAGGRASSLEGLP
jgi:copper chaperone NosL